MTSSRKEIESSLHKLWDLDSIGIREIDKVHEDVVDHIEFTGERYSVGFPKVPKSLEVAKFQLWMLTGTEKCQNCQIGSPVRHTICEKY